MATIASPIGAQCHYTFIAQAREDVTGLGVSVPGIVRGSITDGSELSVELDSNYLWDVYLTFRGAAPVIFEGFNPGAGGDLLTLLAAQGWEPL